MQSKGKKPGVVLITGQLSSKIKIGEMFVVQLLQILEPQCGKLFVIAGNFNGKVNGQVQIINLKRKNSSEMRPVWIRIPRFLLTQLIISAHFTKVSKMVDVALFYLAELNLLPILCSKLLKKKTVVFYLTGRRAYEMSLTEPSSFSRIMIPPITRILLRVVFFLADQIVVEAKNTIEWAGLGKYRDKISVSGARYVDSNFFSVKRELKNRRESVGFIGRLSPEKGIVNFVNAIPLISKELSEVGFLIGGVGPMLNEIEGKLRRNKCRDIVKLVDWIAHDELPEYLNELKLLVIPSYTEGLPTIMLEAMACGTPVLATPVGGIPDVIKDGKTGFILDDNSAESITRGVIRALNYPELLEVTKSARALIESKYSYAAAVQRYETILSGPC
ncbi:MAG TPA: glycosyltransferase family 4 protein [Acidobacteriota bacterium]|nr:glycosyltransferase family 4 protein [Acidobacteriota bacterium]